MMKFASFENIVELIYKNFIHTPKNQCSKQVQLAVSIAGGYAAGVLCAIVSNPADNLVSYLNNSKGATIGEVRFFIFHFFFSTVSFVLNY
jgi:solute carrier family 25 (mitochondrial phosphate transporter), member 3